MTTFDTPAPVRRRAKAIILTVAAMLAIASAALAVHEYTCSEDSCVVWVCAWMGNRTCGPDTPPVIVNNPFVEH